MGHAAPHVAEAPKLDIEPAQIPRQRMAELIVMDRLQSLQAAIRAPLVVTYQLHEPFYHYDYHYYSCNKF